MRNSQSYTKIAWKQMRAVPDMSCIRKRAIDSIVTIHDRILSIPEREDIIRRKED